MLAREAGSDLNNIIVCTILNSISYIFLYFTGSNIYSARLYRNLSPTIYCRLSAVFYICLGHPMYTKVCSLMLVDTG